MRLHEVPTEGPPHLATQACWCGPTQVDHHGTIHSVHHSPNSLDEDHHPPTASDLPDPHLSTLYHSQSDRTQLEVDARNLHRSPREEPEVTAEFDRCEARTDGNETGKAWRCAKDEGHTGTHRYRVR